MFRPVTLCVVRSRIQVREAGHILSSKVLRKFNSEIGLFETNKIKKEQLILPTLLLRNLCDLVSRKRDRGKKRVERIMRLQKTPDDLDKNLFKFVLKKFKYWSQIKITPMYKTNVF